MKYYTKQQVFALAKKHDISIEGNVNRYWGICECEWYAPTDKAFWAAGDRHCAVFECSIGEDMDRSEGVKTAKEFWTDMYGLLKGDIENIVDCDCDECTFDREED